MKSHHAPDAVSDREPQAPVLDTFEAKCWGIKGSVVWRSGRERPFTVLVAVAS